MAWSSDTSATQLTSITTEQFFDATPTLNPGERAHVQIEVDFPSTPTDDAIISFYGTLDASSETWDTLPFDSRTLDNDTDPGAVSVVVEGVYKFRVGVQRTGSTDTITSADMNYRTDGVDL